MAERGKSNKNHAGCPCRPGVKGCKIVKWLMSNSSFCLAGEMRFLFVMTEVHRCAVHKLLRNDDTLR